MQTQCANHVTTDVNHNHRGSRILTYMNGVLNGIVSSTVGTVSTPNTTSNTIPNTTPNTISNSNSALENNYHIDGKNNKKRDSQSTKNARVIKFRERKTSNTYSTVLLVLYNKLKALYQKAHEIFQSATSIQIANTAVTDTNILNHSQLSLLNIESYQGWYQLLEFLLLKY